MFALFCTLLAYQISLWGHRLEKEQLHDLHSQCIIFLTVLTAPFFPVFTSVIFLFGEVYTPATFFQTNISISLNLFFFSANSQVQQHKT